jgi:hypothetical protein
MGRTLLLAVWCLTLTMPAGAQDAATLARGARVRVTVGAPWSEQYTAKIDAIHGDTLLLEGGATRVVLFRSLERLEVSQGRRGHPWRGAGIGFLVGAVTGAVLGPYTVPGEGDTAESKAVAGAVLLGAAGALSGVVIGALIKTDTWEEVPLEGLRVSIAPRGGGVGVGVRLSF